MLQDFITLEEEESFVKEMDPHLKRHIYEKDHWDEAIQGVKDLASCVKLGFNKCIAVYFFKPNFIWFPRPDMLLQNLNVASGT